MTSTGVRADRREQIDGLRVIAMTGVLYVHFWNDRPTLEFVRVSLFFVISGFLIGIILLSAKDSRMTVSVMNFYVRRLLRLFPALFFMLVVASFFNMDNIVNSIAWHAFQASNLYFAMTEAWKPWVVSHLWSLNIVEQFYVFAPLFILFLSRKVIVCVYAFLLIASVMMRTVYADIGFGPWSKIVFAFDPVAAGVILSVLKDKSLVKVVLTSGINNIISIAIIFSPFLFGMEFGHSEIYRFFILYAVSSIVMSSYVGYRGAVGLLLANPATRFLSRVSYATYVYHLAIWWLVAEQWPALYARGPVTFFVVSAATLVAATVSWHLAEKHFDALKVRFPVRRSTPSRHAHPGDEGRFDGIAGDVQRLSVISANEGALAMPGASAQRTPPTAKRETDT